MERILIVGAGPAAAGACLFFEKIAGRHHRIDVVDIGRQLNTQHYLPKIHPAEWSSKVYEDLHRNVRSRTTGWVPEKSYFGGFPSKYHPDSAVYKSDTLGGLSKFWGASFVPFTATDFEDWPISESTMLRYYEHVMAEVPITGEKDALSNYFPSNYVNNPPINVPAEFRWLRDAIGSVGGTGFIAGSPRLAVRTVGDKDCTYCGHCFYGCYRDSIYSADQTIRRLADSGAISYYPDTEVIRFRHLDQSVSVDMRDKTSMSEERRTYDRVYLAAGCLESAHIVSESLKIESFPIVENPVFHVPLLYTGRKSSSSVSDLVSLNNLLIGRLPVNSRKYVHMQVYPLNIYLWRHALSKAFGNLGHELSRLAQSASGHHVYMILLYLDGGYTKGSTLSFANGNINLNFVTHPSARTHAELVLEELNTILRGSKFRVLQRFMVQLAPGGSYHYASTMPMSKLESSGEIAPKVFVLDSSTFPSLPAQNHSFTIMANAYRIAEQSLQKHF